MIIIHTRVLNGLPVRVEADWNSDRWGEITIEDIQVFWDKPNSKRALVIENKMPQEDWWSLEDELLDEFLHRGEAW
jgi:hypothetical protein